MDRFVVPQFIDNENKIIGSITTRQFLLMMVAAILIFVFYKTLDFLAFVVLGLFTLTIFSIIAFVKINGVAFHFFLLNLIQTFAKPRMKIWDKEHTDAELAQLMREIPPPPARKRLVKETMVTSRLSQLTLSVNTGGAYNPDEE